ncbi:PepSY domain-containing protein [Acutalibacter sp. JLR.KK004]|jgi:uncharacterized membrane protein YkoI|uniref:PepSY domain-containing protein n=1 Tax=Acutalibacter sp. JLR.KK004 TaxID=3112622 RepID=UPI002FF06169
MHTSWSRRLGKIAVPALCAVFLASPLAALRASAVANVTAVIRPDMSIVIDGQKQSFFNVNARQVHPLYYAGSTYLPVRAIGELMGKNVDWNQSSKTVTLAGSRTSPPVTGTPDGATQRQDVEASVRDDFTVIVDGAVRSFTNVNGRRVYPLLYRGSTYLPVRAIGELMGKEVDWDQATQTVTLSGRIVTDADTFGLLTPEQAQAKALEHAGLTASQATFTKTELEWENGRRVYDVEFHTAGYQEYDYEIDAVTGAVLSFGHDGDSFTPPDTPGLISLEEAAAKALAQAGVKADQATFTKQVLDWDDGCPVYEMEFFTASPACWYECEIDGTTGRVVSFEADSTDAPPSGGLIAPEEAKAKALAHAGLASGQVTFTKTELELKDGRLMYEIKFHTASHIGYEYKIDATNGTVWSFEQDHSSYLPPIPSGVISVDEAKAAALAHAGLSASQVNFTKQKLDWDDDKPVYEIKFFTKDLVEYDYEIDAFTGKVLSFDRDGSSTGETISREKVQEIALGQVPGASAKHIRKLKLELDDGRYIYEVEIKYGGLEYKMEIDGETGAILEFEVDD